MRNADLTIDEDDAADLLKEIEKQIKQRQWGEVIRLEVEDSIDRELLKELSRQLHVLILLLMVILHSLLKFIQLWTKPLHWC